MRQHVNPLSKNFKEIEIIPPFSEIFEDPELPLHLDIGSAAGDFLFDLALENDNWNYLGIEIREKLVKNAKARIRDSEIRNLYFAFGNANNILNDSNCKFLINYLSSISFNFPDPWFKKKHYKRRIIQPALINLLSNSMQKGSLIFIKTDVRELFDYMDLTISNNLNFRKLDNRNFNFSKSFNPNKIQTNREKYVINNKINIFERIYTKN
tara:strand:+ start:247 stop:876 length:630 start_codon:yes stop_codon:yes gene_type:complete